MKKTLFSSTPVKLVIVMVVVYYIYPWFVIFIGTMSQPDPPKPKITYGEFPFKLVYDIDGKRKVIEDTLICEFDGVGMDEGRGKFRKWKEQLASGNENVLLLKVNDFNPFIVYKEIYYDTGGADYYMDDMSNGVSYEHGFPDARRFEKYVGGGSSDGIIFADELYEKYKIKIISWDYTPPIQNSFS